MGFGRHRPRLAWRRALWRLVQATGLCLLFTVAVAVGVLVHLDLAPSRRLVTRSLNALFAGLFQGRVEILAIDRLGLGRVRVSSVRVVSPDGSEVLRAERLRVRSEWLREILAWAFGMRDASLRFEQTRLEEVEVSLRATAEGKLALAEAFLLREEPDREPRDPSTRPKQPKLLVLDWPRVEIGRLRVTGTLPDGPSVDGELRRIHAALRVDSRGSVSLDVSRAGVREQGLLGQSVAGTAAFHLRIPALRLWGDFTGDVAGVEVIAVARLGDDRVDAVVELPRVNPGALDPWLPGLPIRYPFVGRLAIGGALSELAIAGKLGFPKLPDGLGRGSVAAEGLLTLGTPPALDLAVRADRVDTRMFADEPVWATVDGAGRLLVRLAGDDSELRVLFEGAGPTSLGESLPRTGGTVLVDGDRVATFIRVAEPGSPADLYAQYDSDGTVRTAVELDAGRLDRKSRIGAALARLLGSNELSGTGHVRARARLRDEQLEADFGVALRSVGWPESAMTLRAIDVGGTLSGPLDALKLEAHATGQDFTVGGREVERFRLAARGPLDEPTLFLNATDNERREIEAQAVVAPLRGAARQVKLRVGRDGVPIDARIASIRPGEHGLAVEGVEIDGLGAAGLRGRFAVAGGELEGTLRGTGLALEPIRKLLGMPFPVRGTADVDVELHGTGRARKGHVKLAVHDAGVLVVDGVQARLDVDIDGAEVRTDAKIELTAAASPPSDAPGEGGAMGAAAPAPHASAQPVDPCAGTFAAIEVVGALARLDGPLLAPETYERATGTFPVRMPGIRLACVGQTLAQVFYSGQTAPLAELDGILDAAFDVAREPGTRWPSVRGLRLTTRGLRLVAQPAKADAPPPWASTKLDLDVQGSLEGRTEQASVAVVIRDSEKLLELDAATRLPLDTLLAGDFATAWEAIRRAPTTLRLEVPRRAVASLSTLPDPVAARVSAVGGEAQLLASLDGTLDEPTVTLRLRGWGLSPRRPVAVQEAKGPGWGLPLDVDAVATYARGSSGLESTFSADGKKLAHLQAGLQANLPASLWARKWPPEGWTGAVGLKLDQLPLDALGALAANEIDGTLSGAVTVADLGRSPQLNAELETSAVRWGATSRLRSAKLTVRPVPDSPDGTLVIDGELRAIGAGRLGVTAYGGVRWEDGWRPRVDRQAPADLLVRAEALPLEPFLPLVSPAVSKLQGRLDGDLRLQWQQVAAASDAELSVDMKLTEGVLHVPEIGQELRGVQGHLVSGSGNIVKVEDIAAQATTGRMSGACSVRLDGFDVRDLTGELTVAEGEEVPLTFEGVPLGTASGRFIVHAVKQPDQVELNLTGERLRLTLPAGASQSVQPLPDNPEVTVSHAIDKPRSKRSEGDLRWTVTLGLLDSEVRGSGMRLLFSSNPLLPPTVTVDREVAVGGELLLQSGEFDFLGLGSGLKPFVLDRGLVRFRTEDPSNPYVNMAAHYDAPDGSTITLEYVGLLKPINRDKIRFRSTPPRTEQEIIALLLFGETGSSTATAASSAGAGRDTAAAGGGSIAAYQLNALLGGIAPLRGLSTTFGVTEEGYTSTGVTYQISDTISAQAAYERREQAANSGTVDTTAEGRGADSLSRTRVGVDWRFYQDFLLRGSIGIGDEPTSGLDLMWQYRY